MKLKLFFLLVIVFSGSCAKKIHSANDYSYYKREIDKLNRASEENRQKKETIEQTKVADTSKEPTYLSAKKRAVFAQLLQVSESSLGNEKLYAAIENWLGTPYLWGGTSKNGVDCSSLTQQIYHEVYGRELPRTSIEQFYYDTEAQFKSQEYLREGDLVFFRLRHRDKVVSHVGIYLQNGKFVGSNSPRGVEIADLNSDYWQDKYVACARLLN